MPSCDRCLVLHSHQHETTFIIVLLANDAMIISLWLNSHYLGLHVSSLQLSGKLIKDGLRHKPGYRLCKLMSHFKQTKADKN